MRQVDKRHQDADFRLADSAAPPVLAIYHHIPSAYALG